MFGIWARSGRWHQQLVDAQYLSRHLKLQGAPAYFTNLLLCFRLTIANRLSLMSKAKKSKGADPFQAAELARSAALEDAKDQKYVGSLLSIEADDERIATYLFEANLPGYQGWNWAVTVAKVDSQSAPTICDVVLLPGAGALLAPDWIPYSSRITAGDVGVGTIVPTALDDPRLVPAASALPGDEELDLP